MAGAALPAGWAGKVWALEQGRRRAAAAGPAELLLLTDADILHAPGSLRRLAAEAEAGGLDLVSRMARLRCVSAAERLLIPPFVLFFFLLYPMRWANRPGGRVAAAAGGCVLVRAAALERAGGLRAIRGALIDDLALAARGQALGRRDPPGPEPRRAWRACAPTPTSAPSGGWCGAAPSPSCGARGRCWPR